MITTDEFNGSRFTTHTLATMAEVLQNAANFQAFGGKKYRATVVTPNRVVLSGTKSYVIFTTG